MADSELWRAPLARRRHGSGSWRSTNGHGSLLCALDLANFSAKKSCCLWTNVKWWVPEMFWCWVPLVLQAVTEVAVLEKRSW